MGMSESESGCACTRGRVQMSLCLYEHIVGSGCQGADKRMSDNSWHPPGIWEYMFYMCTYIEALL